MARDPDTAAHWDDAYALGEATRSWFQQQPTLSLRMLDMAGVAAGDSVIDVGGGASPLAGALLGRGFTDVTVLDISATGMQYARSRLGPQAGHVRWLTGDVLTWQPERRYQAWHDRAVFHFLTTVQARRRYLQALEAATTPDAAAVFGCFAPDGPPYCSGLPVARYSPQELAGQLGIGWTLIARDREEHITPSRRGPAVHLGSIPAAALTKPRRGSVGYVTSTAARPRSSSSPPGAWPTQTRRRTSSPSSAAGRSISSGTASSPTRPNPAPAPRRCWPVPGAPPCAAWSDTPGRDRKPSRGTPPPTTQPHDVGNPDSFALARAKDQLFGGWCSIR